MPATATVLRLNWLALRWDHQNVPAPLETPPQGGPASTCSTALWVRCMGLSSESLTCKGQHQKRSNAGSNFVGKAHGLSRWPQWASCRLGLSVPGYQVLDIQRAWEHVLALKSRSQTAPENIGSDAGVVDLPNWA